MSRTENANGDFVQGEGEPLDPVIEGMEDEGGVRVTEEAARRSRGVKAVAVDSVILSHKLDRLESSGCGTAGWGLSPVISLLTINIPVDVEGLESVT